MNQIKRLNGEEIMAGDEPIKSLAEKAKVDLRDANLGGANLRGANLGGANLRGADLWGANLRDANLWGANLGGANLRGAYLWGANLGGANLRDANLRGANLGGANLRGAYLWGAYLWGANLGGANLSFHQFPSIRLLSSIPLGKISDMLTVELMRRDAFGHPFPNKFDDWANGGNCPYQNEERMWHFVENRRLWKPGNPEMTDRDLVIAICKEKGWEIGGTP